MLTLSVFPRSALMGPVPVCGATHCDTNQVGFHLRHAAHLRLFFQRQLIALVAVLKRQCDAAQMEEGGPDGCRFVVEEGKLEDRAVLAQLGSIGRIMAQARAVFASVQAPAGGPGQCAGYTAAEVNETLRVEARVKAGQGDENQNRQGDVCRCFATRLWTPSR